MDPDVPNASQVSGLLGRALEAGPDDPVISALADGIVLRAHGRARFYRAAGRIDFAIRVLGAVPRAHKSYAETCAMAARMYTELGMTDRARAALQEAADERVARSRALWKAGRLAEARAELDKALEEHPEHPGALRLRGEMK